MAERTDLYRKDLREKELIAKLIQQKLISKKLAYKADLFAGSNAFVRAIVLKAPKLLHHEVSFAAVEKMRKISSIRHIEEWQPRGKGYQALLVSLANHLFAAYPMPAFIWSAFWDASNVSLARLIARIASGTSLHSLCTNKILAVSLTKKQCHLLMNMPAKYGFVDALRYVQVMTSGGNLALFNQWRRSRYASTLQTPEMEDFWQHILVWMCQQPELQHKTVEPLLDYIANQKVHRADFNIKGRALGNMIAAMNEWQQLEKIRKLAMGIDLPESDLSGASWEQNIMDKPNSEFKIERWSITEILSVTRLLKEGKSMNHCVYGYRGDIRKGRCSIWSVSCNRQMKLTIEVNNQNKQIVQVRGKNNRDPQRGELQAVRTWARLNQVRCQ